MKAFVYFFSFIIFSFLSKIWKPGSYNGLLVSSHDFITRNVTVLTNKPWSSNESKQHRLTTEENFAKTSPQHRVDDKNEATTTANKHGFLDVTWTRAQTQNVKEKLGHASKTNKDINQIGSASSVRGDKKHRKVAIEDVDITYMNEICLNVQPCDVLTNGQVLSTILSQFLSAVSETQAIGSSRSSEKSTPPTSSSSSSGSFLQSFDFPLLYIDVSAFRLFVPTCNLKKTSAANPKVKTNKLLEARSLFDPDVIILQVRTDNDVAY